MIFLLYEVEKMSWEIIRNSVGEELQIWGISVSQVQGTGKMNCKNEITCLWQLISIKLHFQFVAVSQICHFTGTLFSVVSWPQSKAFKGRQGHHSWDVFKNVIGQSSCYSFLIACALYLLIKSSSAMIQLVFHFSGLCNKQLLIFPEEMC